MNLKQFEGKAAMTAVLAAITSVLGWRGSMAVVWVAAMLLDYLSGSASACKDGQWSSATARQGLWHKGGMILVVLVAAIADGTLTALCDFLQMKFRWPGCVLPLVLGWYIITELGSILENAVKMGAQVPQWLTKMLRCSLNAVNQAAENGLTGESDEK